MAGLAEVCDVSLLDRLRNAGDWLAHLLDQRPLRKRAQACGSQRLRLVLLDGSSRSCPGRAGSDWGLHARYEPACGGFTALRVTAVTSAEGLQHLRPKPDDRVVQDRGYARVAACTQTRDRAGGFITCIGWEPCRSPVRRSHHGAPPQSPPKG